MKKPLVLNISPEDVQRVPDGWQYARQRDFTGGENLAKLPELVKRNQFIKMENAIISPEGQVTDCWQMDTLAMQNTVGIGGLVLSAPGSDGQFTFWHSNVTEPSGGAVRSGTMTMDGTADANVGTVVGITGAQIAGLSYAVSYLGKHYCCNDSGGVLNLTNSLKILNGALVGRIPLKLKAYANRLWAVCSGGQLVFSNNGDATTWDAGNIILLPNQEPIIDFIPVQGGAIVYSHTSAYAFYGTGVYQDTSIILIRDNVALSAGAVLVDDSIYVVGNRGMNQIALNGFKELPHNQDAFFAANAAVWNALTTFGTLQLETVQAVYLSKFHAILYLMTAGSATQGFLYYVGANSYAKINQTISYSGVRGPFLLPISDGSTDFIVRMASGICKSVYPSGALATARPSIIQTRFEDADSTREKIWRHLCLTMDAGAYNAIISVFLDYSETPVSVRAGILDLAQGENTIELFDSNGGAIRGKAISVRIELNTLSNLSYLIGTEGQALCGPDGALLTAISMPAPSSFKFREIRIKYCEVGAPK